MTKLKLDLALIIGMILTLMVADFSEFCNNYKQLQADVLRIHILANSDSDDDQNVKIKVRDELLKKSKEFFEGCVTQADLINRANEIKDKITDLANSVLEQNGFEYSATVQVVNMEFDDRIYNDFTMPAGEYEAIRITLGNATGQNWWCVMYPPLCVPYATETVENPENYFTEEEVDIIKNPKKYKVKFKILEFWEKYFNK